MEAVEDEGIPESFVQLAIRNHCNAASSHTVTAAFAEIQTTRVEKAAMNQIS